MKYLKIKNLSIKTKLILLVLFSSIALVCVGLVGNYGIQKASNLLKELGNDRLPSIIGLGMINEGQTAIRLAHRDALVYQYNYNAQENFAEILQTKQRIWERINKGLSIYVAIPQDTKEMQTWQEFLPAWEDWKQGQAGISTTIEALSKNQGEEGQKQLFVTYFKQVQLQKPRAAKVKEIFDKLVELNQQYDDDDIKNAITSVNNSCILMLITGLATVVMALFLGFAVILSITRPLAMCMGVAQKIANGDLSSTISVDSQDETGELLQALQTMQLVLRSVIGDVEWLVSAAVNGDFSKQIDLNNHQGYAKDLGAALNKLSDTTNSGLNDIMRVAGALATGDLSQRIIKDYPGAFGQTKASVNCTVDALTKMIDEIQYITHTAANQGDFSVNIAMDGKAGYSRTLSERLNQLCEVTDTGLNDVLRLAYALSKGDLTQTINRSYPGAFGQVKEAMNGTVENLAKLVVDIKNSTDTINTAAKEIAVGNNELSHRTEQQAASLQQTAASMEQLTSAVQHNAENAKSANQLAVAASDIAGKGVEVVGQVVKTMIEINDSSRRVGDIISVIDDIAFQTNILALNAAVEAARAGEQGRGFAVVAVEVRNLAQRAATAAGEIKILIEDSVTKVNGGSQLVSQAGQTMEEIVKSIHGVTTKMYEISSSSDEQTAGIQQVNMAIGQMDEVTQQNAALVEQAAAVAESLEEQVQNLSITVSQFKVDGHFRNERAVMSQTKSTSSFRSASPQRTKEETINKMPSVKPKPISQSSNDEWEEF